ncbi:MAG: Mu-like prophage major head subunit gpT family protein [Pseudomonadota bacterium]
MAIISPALLTSLHTSYKMDFQRGQARATPMWDRVATEIQSSAASNTYGWLGRFPSLRQWVGDRVIKDMKAHGYKIDNQTFEATIGIDRDDIEDDVLGTYSPMFEEMGYAATIQVDQAVYALLNAGDTTLCYDGQNYFDTDHPVFPNHDGTGTAETVSNYKDGTANSGTPGPAWFLLQTTRPLKPLIYQNRRAPEFVTKFDPQNSDHVFMKKEYLWGVDRRFSAGFGLWQFAYMSKEPLTSDTLQLAFQDMMAFKADGGTLLGVIPDLLVVPPALDGAATIAVKNMFDAAGASNKTYQKVDCATVPWLAA